MNLDLDSERSFTTWYASAKLLIAAWTMFVAFSSAKIEGTRWKRCGLVALPATLALLSADEIAGLHEHVGVMMDRFLIDRHDSVFPITNFWMIPCAVLLTCVAVPMVRAVTSVSQPASVGVALGIALLIAGAGGVEMLQNFVVPGSRLHWLQIATEETIENLAGTLLVFASLRFAEATEKRGAGGGSFAAAAP